MRISVPKTPAGWAVIGVGAAAAAVLFGVPEQRNVPAPVASSQAQTAPPVVAASRGSLAELLANASRAPLPRERAGELFAGHAPAAAPQVQAATIPAKPVVPPFPFKYAGWLREGGGSAKVYLERGTSVFPIKAGDVLEGFRIDAIHDQGIDVTFLALGQQSSIMFASLTGGTDGAATFAGTAGYAGTQPSPQPAAVAAGSATSAVASATTPQAGLAGGKVPSPAAAAAPVTPRSLAAISQAISGAENAPPSGSMPTGPAPAAAMQVGPVTSSAFPAGSAPSGRLGIEAAGSGRLGSEIVQGGKLGL